MNEKPYCTYMAFQFFGKRKGFTHESGDPLPDRVVETFDIIRHSAILSDGTVTFGREDSFVSPPKIGVNNGALTICGRKRFPRRRRGRRRVSRRFPACPRPSPTISNICCPIFVVLASDEGPHVVALDRQSLFPFSDYFNFLFNAFVLRIDVALKPGVGNLGDAADSGERSPFKQHVVHKCHLITTELGTQALHGKQALHEKMEEAGRQIYDSLADGAVHAATEVARNLSTWFEETIWTAYLTCLFQCREILFEKYALLNRPTGGANPNTKIGRRSTHTDRSAEK